MQSVASCLRVGSDGLLGRETVALYFQTIAAEPAELVKYRIRTTDELPVTGPITLYGGGTLVFDESGRLKYHVVKRLLDGGRQSRWLDACSRSGYFKRRRARVSPFAEMHRQRFLQHGPAER